MSDNCGNAFYGQSMSTLNSWGVETSGTPMNRYLVNPLFVDAPDGIDKGIDVDFHLQAGSPAINAGVDVQSIIEGFGLPYTDIDGNSLDSTPDCGAYQYPNGGNNQPLNDEFLLYQNYPNPFNPEYHYKIFVTKANSIKNKPLQYAWRIGRNTR
ncbi:MAG: hypothetical protein MZV64_69480 [Ignavibacteriales bacterium]|nr:hypothetical protein [Ignavibacteriales bacterium]